MQTLLDLIKVEWAEKLTGLACTILVRRRFSLPSPKNIAKLTHYVTNELKTTKLEVESNLRIGKMVQTNYFSSVNVQVEK
jgi:hypothetical protein